MLLRMEMLCGYAVNDRGAFLNYSGTQTKVPTLWLTAFWRMHAGCMHGLIRERGVSQLCWHGGRKLMASFVLSRVST